MRKDQETVGVQPMTKLQSIMRSWVLLVFFVAILAYVSAKNVPYEFKIASTLLSMALLYLLNNGKNKVLSERHWEIIAYLVLTTSILVNFFISIRFDSILSSDFGVYFNCGIASNQGMENWIRGCQSHYLHQNLIYWDRSLFYTTLFNYIFGLNYQGLKLYNAAWQSLSLIIWYLLLRRFYSSRVATIATLLFSLYPERLFAVTLSTTDNIIFPFFFVTIFSLPALSFKKLDFRFIAKLAIFSLSIFICSKLRTIGPLLILTTIFWYLIATTRKFIKYDIAILLTLLFINMGLGLAISSFLPQNISDPLQLLKALSSIDFSSTQDFGSNYSWMEYFWFSIPREFRSTVAFNKIFIELSNGLQYLPIYIFKKSGILFDGTGYYGFSSFLEQGYNPDTINNHIGKSIKFSIGLFPYLTSFVYVYIFLSLNSVLNKKIEGPALVLLLWTGVFSFIVLGLGETQPRYSLLLAPALSLFAALSFSDDRSQAKNLVVKILNYRLHFALFGILFIYFIFSLMVMSLKISSHFKTSNISSLVNGSAVSGCESKNVIINQNYKIIRIVMPRQSVCAAVKIKIENINSNYNFFISGAKFPFIWENPHQSPFSYKVLMNDTPMLSSALGEKAVQWYKINPVDIKNEKNNFLTFIFYRSEENSDDEIDITLLN
jgi:hypothetical protein